MAKFQKYIHKSTLDVGYGYSEWPLFYDVTIVHMHPVGLTHSRVRLYVAYSAEPVKSVSSLNISTL